MIKKVKLNCDYCKDDKDCFAFRFQAHVCESCLNENGIMSMNATEKQLLEFGLQDSIRTGFDNDERKELLERLKNVKAEAKQLLNRKFLERQTNERKIHD